jgi:hypothetical protein
VRHATRGSDRELALGRARGRELCAAAELNPRKC